MTNMLSQAALLLNKTYRLLSTGPSKAKSDPSVPPESCILLDLPNELMTMICKDEVLTNKDLASLRLTCKHTKYFASDILDQRLFVDKDAWYSRYARRWFLHFSDPGSHVQSLLLVRPPLFGRSDLDKGFGKPDYSQLQDLRVTWHDWETSAWMKVFRAAVHLKVFKFDTAIRIRTGYQVLDSWRFFS
jgi:hypothetical protein